ncbi:MAG: activator of (R)-2-hydroxyglutaryl-CoA dehydratase [Chlorobi bacterium]|nr:activator of (R)-2-hydroxyglutaryl-CoA dehydratase [Chlorobiota bacterium]MCI0716782.1 activator of (R)-2-hydroxyglutaryl-CoA dehydratase [Chlorobiota bacterium]
MENLNQNGVTTSAPVGIKLKKPESKETEIQRLLLEERIRLEKEYGVKSKPIDHFKRPFERMFTKDERANTTILFGGLTWKHEKLIKGVLQGLGYNASEIPVPDKRAFQLGKEYGNNGQCNPTYFTVGNLVQYLQSLEAQGLSKKEIMDNYVFFTAGACGPCRFGMYEAEYRLALRNSGFDGFRVLIFQQTGGLEQAEVEAGLEMNLDFFLGIINAMNIGDIINDVAYQIRAFEVNPGETDKVLDECMEMMYERMKQKKYFNFNGLIGDIVAKVPGSSYISRFVEQKMSDYYLETVREIRNKFNEVKVDRTKVKPICKVTGEFWAQTTEGDGNFNMFPFLHREGAQLLVEPIATWILYMLHQAKNMYHDRKGLKEGEEAPKATQILKKMKMYRDYKQTVAILTIAEKVFENEYNRIRKEFNNLPHALANQLEMQRLGHPFYNSRVEGGEGHLEIAKNIYYVNKDLCHMVLSLKPFGCMPSTQSDGVQSAVTSMFKDMIFIPIETSGEGDINAHSRVQMALGEAKAKAKNEFKNTLEQTGYSLEEIKAYVESHDELTRPFYIVPHTKGVVGVAANFVLHVAERMKKEGIRPVINVSEEVEA